MATVGKLKQGQTFSTGDVTLYYVRGEYNRGTKRFHCKAYTLDHRRYKWMDRHHLKGEKVTRYERK